MQTVQINLLERGTGLGEILKQKLTLTGSQRATPNNTTIPFSSEQFIDGMVQELFQKENKPSDMAIEVADFFEGV